MLRRMLSDQVSSTTATNAGSAFAYKRLPSRERSLTEIHVERMNTDSGAGLVLLCLSMFRKLSVFWVVALLDHACPPRSLPS